MKTYKVVRPHMGDKFYETGATRKAKPTDVAHLVEKGVLEPVETEADEVDGPQQTALQRSLTEAPLDGAPASIEPPAELAEAIAAAEARFADEKASAVAQAVADAETAAKATLQRALDDQAAEHAKAIDALKAQHEADKAQAVTDAVAALIPPADSEKAEPAQKDKAEPKVKDKAAS